jgi:hypothetical protein
VAWQVRQISKRFKPVEDGKESERSAFEATCFYIPDNPIRAKLCRNPSEYSFSGCCYSRISQFTNPCRWLLGIILEGMPPPHGGYFCVAALRIDFLTLEKPVSFSVVPNSRTPQRIVALGADGADILYQLGAWPQVVGTTAFYRPPAGAEAKPRVSGFSSGNLQMILELDPDLVITSTDVQHQLASDLI